MTASPTTTLADLRAVHDRLTNIELDLVHLKAARASPKVEYAELRHAVTVIAAHAAVAEGSDRIERAIRLLEKVSA